MGTVHPHFDCVSFGRSDDGRKRFKMSQERVKSKNLFNFRPQGFIDPVVVAEDEKMKQDFGLDPAAMEEHMKNQSETEFVEEMRGFMGGFLGNTPFKTDPVVVEAYASCSNSELAVPTKHDGEYNVKVLVHEPKSLAGEKNRPAIVYAHGGGCIGGTADLYEHFLAHVAVDCRWSSTTLTTGSRRRPGAPIMCSTFTRRSSMWQQ